MSAAPDTSAPPVADLDAARHHIIERWHSVLLRRSQRARRLTWDKPAIQLDEEPTIVVREPDAATQVAPQDNQLVSERGILSLKPDLRLEQRGQHGQDETR
jgi:hypothetical protein